MSGKQLLDSIVIDASPTGESDLLVTLLTLEMGKIRCIAKGARKSKKRFMNVLEPFSNIDAVVREPVKTGLFFLENGSLRRGFESVRTNYDSYVLASLCLELADLWCKELQKEKDVYRLLLWYLESLEKGRDCTLCTLIFKTRLLKACGFLPPLGICQGCKKEPSGHSLEFDSNTGQIYCTGCRNGQERLCLGLSALKSMDFWQSQSLDKVFRLKVNSRAAEDAWMYLKSVHCNLLERQPRAYEVTEAVIRKTTDT